MLLQGVNNSRLTAAGHCGDNSKEEEYTHDDVRALLLKTNDNINFYVCPVPPPPACPDQQQQQQQQQQGATVVLGVLLGVCLLACVALATAHCYNKASFRDMMARSPFQLSTSKQFLWPSRGTNNQSANQDATQGANRDATQGANQGANQDANQGANHDANQGATQDATQGANQGARPGGRASAHDSENSLYGATIDRQ
nr:probable serine/threonine-protein kinase pdkA isoform X2 [Procambarus clarkii]